MLTYNSRSVYAPVNVITFSQSQTENNPSRTVAVQGSRMTHYWVEAQGAPTPIISWPAVAWPRRRPKIDAMTKHQRQEVVILLRPQQAHSTRHSQNQGILLCYSRSPSWMTLDSTQARHLKLTVAYKTEFFFFWEYSIHLT